MDGVASSGKTSILKDLHAKILEQYPTSTKLFISEHYTERMLEHLKESGALNGIHVKKHIASIVNNLADFQNMLNQSKFAFNPKSTNTFVTLERFILTHLTSLPIEKDYSIDEARHHFSQLNEMGLGQVVLVVPKENLKERLLSTIKYRNDVWKKHLFSRGNEDEIVLYYLNWQQNFINYADKFKNSIDTLVLDVKDADYTKYSNIILNHFFR